MGGIVRALCAAAFRVSWNAGKSGTALHAGMLSSGHPVRGGLSGKGYKAAGILSVDSQIPITVAELQKTEDDAQSCATNSIYFCVVLTEDNVQYLCPTCSEGPMKRTCFPRVGLDISLFIFMMLCTALLCVNRAVAQQATAQITGAITDPTGAVVVGAKITLKNSDTNVARSTTTNKDGDFLFTLVTIGTYELEVERQGFDTYVQKGITL